MKDSSAVILCAASVSEAISAALIGSRFSGAERILLFDLRVNFDAAAVISRLGELRALNRWNREVLINTPNTAPAGWRRQFQERAIVREALARTFPGGHRPALARVSVGFTVLHDYVRHAIGVLPDAERVYFPHSFDQPRVRQIRELPDLLGPRRQKGWRGLQTMRWRLMDAAYRLRGWGRDGRLFGGVDRAFTFSPHAPAAPYERIPPEELQSFLASVAALPAIRTGVEAVRAVLGGQPTGVLLLAELNDRSDAALNPDRGRAYAEVLRAVAERNGLRRFLAKPHPRSSRETYALQMDQIRAAAPDVSLLEWPEAAGPLSVEVLISAVPFVCVASLASCSAPPWATPGVAHYVSSAAGRIFDQGWRGPRAHDHCYERYARELQEEGVAIDLAASASSAGDKPA